MIGLIHGQLHPERGPPADRATVDRQLRRDRWIAVLLVAGLVALMAFLTWLAAQVPEVNGVDTWWMMP